MSRSAYLDSSMARQSAIAPSFAKLVLDSISQAELAGALPIKEIFDAQKIILTGCGDSWMAGIAAKPFFEKYVRRETMAMRCIEFSRYYDSKSLGYSPNTPLVVAISFSGTVSRVVEAMKRATAHGANTLLITGNPNSPAAKEARHVLQISYPEGEYQPGLNSYIGAMTTLILLALRMGYVRDLMSRAEFDQAIADIENYCASYAGLVDEWNIRLRDVAEQWKDLRCYDFIADGADFATALFGAAKVAECFGGRATCDDSEDWCHINYFIRNPETVGRVMICNEDGPTFGRCLESLHAIEQLQSPCVIVTDADPTQFPKNMCVIQTPKAKNPMAAPLMQHLPLCLLAGHIGVLRGVAPFRADDAEYAAADQKIRSLGCGIKDSKIVLI